MHKTWQLIYLMHFLLLFVLYKTVEEGEINMILQLYLSNCFSIYTSLIHVFSYYVCTIQRFQLDCICYAPYLNPLSRRSSLIGVIKSSLLPLSYGELYIHIYQIHIMIMLCQHIPNNPSTLPLLSNARIVLGYIFLINVFVILAQATGVLGKRGCE